MKHLHRLHGSIVILLLASLIILLFAVLLARQPQHVTSMPITISVGDHVGFDVNTTALHFGTLPPGGVGERAVTVTPEDDSLITFSVDGIGMVFPTENNIVAKEGMTRTVTFKAVVPENQPYGTYTGTLLIISQKV